MVAIDAATLMLFLRPESGRPLDANGRPIEHAADRVEHLVSELNSVHTTIIIPTPALAEVLVRADARRVPAIIEEIQRHAVFRLEPFDALAAIEVASMNRDALRAGKKRGDSSATWAKLKYDQQIVAIAKVKDCTAIYSDDGDIRTIGRRVSIPVIGIADLPLPPATAQFDLELPRTEE